MGAGPVKGVYRDVDLPWHPAKGSPVGILALQEAVAVQDARDLRLLEADVLQARGLLPIVNFHDVILVSFVQQRLNIIPPSV